MRAVLLLLTVLVTCRAQAPPPGPSCPVRGQEYRCGRCQALCTDLRPICDLPFPCEDGCFCPSYWPVLVESPSGAFCGTESDCSDVCPVREQIYTECGGCQATCANPQPDCDRSCHAGCFCPPDNRILIGSGPTAFCGNLDQCPDQPVPCEIAGQVYTDCGRCESTCWDMDPVCTQQCREGCFCPPENPILLEHPNFAPHCSNEAECYTICNIQGQIYRDCGGCQATCGNPDPQCDRSRCRSGCFCPPDRPILIEHSGGDYCGSRVDCNSGCSIPGQRVTDCGRCEPSCYDLDPFCDGSCQRGCFCPTGTVLVEHPGGTRCDSVRECYMFCEIQGQVYTECAYCQATCGNLDPPCPAICRAGCFCPPENPVLIRDPRSREQYCGIPQQCDPDVRPTPASCDIEGQVFSDCDGHCQPTCDDPDPRCDRRCVPGCVCEESRPFLQDGRCQTRNQCFGPPVDRCPIRGQEYTRCSGQCRPATCQDRDPECDRDRCEPGCVCGPLTPILIAGGFSTFCGTTDDCFTAPTPSPCSIEGQQFSDCFGHCQSTCLDLEPSCDQRCVPGCVCAVPQYVLIEHPQGPRCGTQQECFAYCSVRGQVYTECGGCQATCDDPNPPCPFICQRGCTCPPDNPILIQTQSGPECGKLMQCPREQSQVDLLIAVDASDSMRNPAAWSHVLQFLTGVVDYLPIGRDQVKVGVITFGYDARVDFYWDDYVSEDALTNRINRLSAMGGVSDLQDALRLALIVMNGVPTPSNYVNRPSAPDKLLVILDGSPDPYNPGTVTRQVEDLRRDGVELMAVGVGYDTNMQVLEELDPDYVFVNRYDQLPQNAQNIAGKISQVAGDCPAPMQTMAFSTSIDHDTAMVYEEGMALPFNDAHVNVGGHFDTRLNGYFCPCDGYYKFMVTISGVDSRLGVAIVVDGEVVSPLAYVADQGAMSTTTITPCRENQFVQVMVMLGQGVLSCSIDTMRHYGFSGYIISTM